MRFLAMMGMGMLAGVAVASPASAQVTLEGEYATFDVPSEDFSAEEELDGGAFSAMIYGSIDLPDDYVAMAEVEIETLTGASPTEAVRAGEYRDGEPITERGDGVESLSAENDTKDTIVWIARPRGDGVLRTTAKVSGLPRGDALALARRIADGVVLKDSVTGGVTLAEADAPSGADDAPPVDAAEEARLAAELARLQAEHAARTEAAAAAPSAQPTRQAASQAASSTPASAPPAAAPYPVTILNGSFNVYPKDGFWTLYIMSDGTAQRVTRPVQGAKDFPSVSIDGAQLVLRGPETIVYDFTTDTGGNRMIKRRQGRGVAYENAWPVAAVTPQQAAAWVGSFEQRRSSSSQSSGYVRPGEPAFRAATTGRSGFRFDRGRYEATDSFVMNATLARRGTQAEADADRAPGNEYVTGGERRLGTGTYTVDGYRLLLTPDDGSGTYERTIHVTADGSGGQTLYIDGELWLGDFDVF